MVEVDHGVMAIYNKKKKKIFFFFFV
jgi:hypothetical protein